MRSWALPASASQHVGHIFRCAATALWLAFSREKVRDDGALQHAEASLGAPAPMLLLQGSEHGGVSGNQEAGASCYRLVAVLKAAGKQCTAGPSINCNCDPHEHVILGYKLICDASSAECWDKHVSNLGSLGPRSPHVSCLAPAHLQSCSPWLHR